MEKKQEYLHSICKNLLFCARQGIAIRGHGEKDCSGNRGTFLELLNLRPRDNSLKKFFKERGKYFSYSSKEIQNELLDLMSKQVLEEIASEAIQSDCYAILVDETTDMMNKFP